MAVSGVCSGGSRGKSGKVPGKWLDKFSRIAKCNKGTGKGKPAANLGSTLPGRCPHLPCGVFFKSTVPAFSSLSKLYPLSRVTAVHRCSFGYHLDGPLDLFFAAYERVQLTVLRQLAKTQATDPEKHSTQVGT